MLLELSLDRLEIFIQIIALRLDGIDHILLIDDQLVLELLVILLPQVVCVLV